MGGPNAIVLVLTQTGWRWSLHDGDPVPVMREAIARSRDEDDGLDAEQAVSQALAVKASYQSSKSAFR